MKYHPMWIILFLIFGLTLTNILLNPLFLYSLIIIGIVIMFLNKNTPSETIRFEKDRVGSSIVWITVILITITLSYDLLIQDLNMLFHLSINLALISLIILLGYITLQRNKRKLTVAEGETYTLMKTYTFREKLFWNVLMFIFILASVFSVAGIFFLFTEASEIGIIILYITPEILIVIGLLVFFEFRSISSKE